MRHTQSQNYREMEARRLQHDAAQYVAIANTQTFETYRDDLEQVEVLKYLGRLLLHFDGNAQAVQVNLYKARKCWAWIPKVLWAENASPHMSGVFYRATVQAVLLFDSET